MELEIPAKATNALAALMGVTVVCWVTFGVPNAGSLGLVEIPVDPTDGAAVLGGGVLCDVWVLPAGAAGAAGAAGGRFPSTFLASTVTAWQLGQFNHLGFNLLYSFAQIALLSKDAATAGKATTEGEVEEVEVLRKSSMTFFTKLG